MNWCREIGQRLRTVAATKDLVELHAKRDEFASAVQAIVTHDLASNGLTLESVTISSLDQTDPSQLQERNVFDAQAFARSPRSPSVPAWNETKLREAERQVQEKTFRRRKKCWIYSAIRPSSRPSRK